MIKLSRFLKSRSSLGISLDIGDTLGFNGSMFSAGISTAAQKFSGKGGQFSERIFAPYSIFKGKAALSVNPIRPTFVKSNSGSLVVGRRGVVMMMFMPAVGERKYDFEKRQNFALSATEVGSLISMGPKDSAEFFHDPSMLSSNAGQVRKSLSIKPYGDSGNGYFISLTVAHNVQKTNDRLNVPVTIAEFAVLKSACSFALPHIMGWDRLTTPKMPLDMVGSPSKVDPRVPDLEWDK